jgi:L-amino acid N-acyltransferase YncA
MTTIRPSREDDLVAITAIYGHHVLHSTGTFETVPPTSAEMAARRVDVLDKNLPWLVAESGGTAIGFAYANWFKPRPAYRYSVENSIYLAPSAQGKGTGRALLAELLAQLERGGIRKTMAIVGDSANAASIALHRSLGFGQVGVVENCGWKFGAWRDIVILQKTLGAGSSHAPDEVAGP